MTSETTTTEQAISSVATLRRFCLAVIEHDRTDKQRYLTEAMLLRAALIKSEEFTSDFLDGMADGLRNGLRNRPYACRIDSRR